MNTYYYGWYGRKDQMIFLKQYEKTVLLTKKLDLLSFTEMLSL